MKAMVLKSIVEIHESKAPLVLDDMPVPIPEKNELLIKIAACGVCHTELDEIEGRTPPPVLPVIPGHQVVGRVTAQGPDAGIFQLGDRVGVGWIYSSCGDCKFCLSGKENLCTHFTATGRDTNGGYAQYIKAPEDSVFKIPDYFSDEEAAPLLCAGAIGFRSLKLANLEDGEDLGLTGFGGSGHQVLLMARYLYPNSDVFVFTRTASERQFAHELGAAWTGDIGDVPPTMLNSIIETTPVWKPVVESLKNLKPGGRLVINAIRKEDYDKEYLLNLDYKTHLWMEKEIKSVANVVRADIQEFLELAASIPLKPEIEIYELKNANRALVELKTRKIRGAKVLKI